MTPYLILHKVRNEPAFDIAIPLKIGSEDGWIIPTSGHRAFPYKTWDLDSLITVFDDFSLNYYIVTFPSDWPDHYSCNDQKRAPSTPTETLSLDEIGL